MASTPLAFSLIDIFVLTNPFDIEWEYDEAKWEYDEARYG